jgi:hypothetical protein
MDLVRSLPGRNAQRPERRSYTSIEWESKREFICDMLKDGTSHAEVLQSLEEKFPEFRPT